MEPGSITGCTEFRALLYLMRKDEGGRHAPIFDRYRPHFSFGAAEVAGVVTFPAGTDVIMPGDTVEVVVQLIQPVAVQEGVQFAVHEGSKTVGAGSVTKIIK